MEDAGNNVSLAACWSIDCAADIIHQFDNLWDGVMVPDLQLECMKKRPPLYILLDRIRKVQLGCMESIIAV